MSFEALTERLAAHEQRSQARYEALCAKLDAHKETVMSDGGINTDKVVVNAGGGGESNLGAMAAIAALGNRNEGSDNAALIAALGNRNDDSNSWGPMLAMMNNRRGDYDGFGGMNGILGIAALGLIFGRGGRGGLFGGGGDCDGGGGGAESRLQSNADTLALLAANGNTKDAVTGGFATTGLALSQGFANTRDAVQALALFQSQQLNAINQNVSEQGCKTREVAQAGTTAILSALAADRISELQAKVCALESHGRARETELNISQNVNQQQAQWQSQRFDDERFNRLALVIGNQVQRARSDQDVVNFGTMAASGNQSSQNTQVR